MAMLKIKDGVELRPFHDCFVAVSQMEGLCDNLVISLNSTSAFLWERLAEGCTEQELVQQLLQTYDIDAQKAEKDVRSFLKALAGAGVLDEV